MGSKPKAPGETREQREARLAEEERIRTMQARADADEAAAGRRVLTKKTRAVVRVFGARRAMALGSGSSVIPGGVPGTSGGCGGGGGSGGGSVGGGGVDSGGGWWNSAPL